MTTPRPANGYLVITAINSDTGEAGSETYQLQHLLQTTTDGGNVARYVGRDTDGEDWIITQHPLGEILPEVRPYRELIQALIAADTPCPGFACSITTLGHLLLACTPEQQDIVRALDPDAR